MTRQGKRSEARLAVIAPRPQQATAAQDGKPGTEAVRGSVIPPWGKR